MGMLFVNCFCHQTAVGSQHKPAHFGAKLDIRHTRRFQHLFVCLTYALADFSDVRFLLIRAIGNAHAAGKVDKGHRQTSVILNFHRQTEQLPRQRGVIVILCGVRGQKCVDSHFLGAPLLQNFRRLNNLRLGHAVFCLTRGIHNGIGNLKVSAGIVTAADFLGNIADGVQQTLNMGNIVQIDDGAQFFRQLEIFQWSIVGREHNVLSPNAHALAEHQFRQRGAVHTAALFMQDFHNRGIRRCLHRKIFFISRIP